MEFERRVLIDGDLDSDLLASVQYLLSYYGPHHPRSSLIPYLSEFLHFCAYQLGTKKISHSLGAIHTTS